jgi:hypothetical protein
MNSQTPSGPVLRGRKIYATLSFAERTTQAQAAARLPCRPVRLSQHCARFPGWPIRNFAPVQESRRRNHRVQTRTATVFSRNRQRYFPVIEVHARFVCVVWLGFSRDADCSIPVRMRVKQMRKGKSAGSRLPRLVHSPFLRVSIN